MKNLSKDVRPAARQEKVREGVDLEVVCSAIEVGDLDVEGSCS